MSEFNFDRMKNVYIPESFVNGALNVPTVETSPVFFFRYSKTLAFVASIVLVCILGVALFFITDKNTAIPSVKITETECETTAPIVENTTFSADATKTQKPSEKPAKSTSTETEKSETITKETVKETEKKEDPTEIVGSLDGKPETDATENEEKPTKPTTPTSPVEPPEDEVPPDGPVVEIEQSYVSSYHSGIITAKVHKSQMSDSFYCRIYDSSGKLLGGENLHSYSKRAEIVIDSESVEDANNNFSTVEYDVGKLSQSIEKGRYYVVFYTDYGVDICSEYIYVS